MWIADICVGLRLIGELHDIVFSRACSNCCLVNFYWLGEKTITQYRWGFDVKHSFKQISVQQLQPLFQIEFLIRLLCWMFLSITGKASKGTKSLEIQPCNHAQIHSITVTYMQARQKYFKIRHKHLLKTDFDKKKKKPVNHCRVSLNYSHNYSWHKGRGCWPAKANDDDRFQSFSSGRNNDSGFLEAVERTNSTDDIFNCGGKKKKEAAALSVCRVLTFHATLRGISRVNCLCSRCLGIQFHRETSVSCWNEQSWLVGNGAYLKPGCCSG